MMKWLRAHTKQIMVVTVLLAMFSFVGGSALVQILAPSQDKDPVIKAFGRDVLVRDIRVAEHETEVLQKLGVSWQYDQPDRKMTAQHWYVLWEEAKNAGLAVSDAEIEEEVKQLQDMYQSRNASFDLFEFFRTQYRITPPDIRNALGRHLLIMKNAQFLGSAAVPSEQQVRHYVRDTQDKVKVQFIALDAEKFIDPSLPLSAEQIQAQFEKYKAVEKDKSDTGMGYMHPRRVKMQYVVADVKAIEPLLAVSFEETKNYWKANKSKYRKIIYEDPPPTSEPATSQPTSQPKPTPVAKSVEKSLAEAKPDVERDIRKKNAQKLSEQAMAKLAAVLQKPWMDAKTDPDTGYKPVPEAVKDAAFLKTNAERIGKEFGVQLAYKETGLISADELEKESDLKGMAVAGETAGMKISEYAFRVPAFYKHEKNEAGAVEASMSLQLYQTPDAPLTASDMGMMFSRMAMPKDRLSIFRVIDASDAQPASSVDDVRSRIEKDLRLEAAMKAMEPQVRELAAAAARIGLKDAWPLFDNLKTKSEVKEVSTPVPFARRASKNNAMMRDAIAKGETTLDAPDVAGLGSSQEFVDQCFAMAAEGWAQPAFNATGDKIKAAMAKPATTPPPAVNVILLQKLGKWCVVEKLGVEKVDEGKYAGELREQNFNRLVAERGGYLYAQWFKLDNIEKRTGFERIGTRPVPNTREGIKQEPKSNPLLDFQ